VEGLRGDAVLNGEPSGLTVRIGEKGRVPLILRARGQAAHGSFAGYVGENAIMKMVKALPRVEALQGTPAPLDAEALSLTSGGTDCRFWRLLGVPAVSYGPKVYGMGGVDEHITLEDLATTARVHMGTIIGFLTGRG